MGETANEWTKRKIREAFKNVRPVKGRIRVPEETTGYIVGLEKENDRLRARVAALEAREARLVAVLEECAKDLEDEITNRYVGTSNYPSMIARMNRDLEPVGRARAELDAVKGGGDDG